MYSLSSKFQLLQIGSYYILKHHTEESFCRIKDCDNVSSGKILISSRIHLWSLSFSSGEAVINDESSDDPSRDDSSGVLIRDQVELLLTGNASESCSDVYLHLPTNAGSLLEVELKEMKGGLIKPVMTPVETSNSSPHILTTMSVYEHSSGSPDASCLFPEGNFISVVGHVVAIHGFDCNSANVHSSCESLGDILRMRFFQGVTSNSCVHVSVDNQMVITY